MTFKNNSSEWWRGAVIYQIYPRSYQDTNGDGVGDIVGITKRIPHIASLGVDAIWISPFFPSPMKDFGYDVSDYCDIDPIFGTLDDFDNMVSTAHSHGLRIMIDLVLSHTSDQHAWFQESLLSRDNPKSDWYVWSDAKPDGSPPNNWLSIFGGTAWQWHPKRCQYYLHNFLSSQPDLNFHNEEVKKALLDVAKFWLERGVNGFRLDTINFYMHDEQLRDNPPLPEENRNSVIAPAVNPYNHQKHLYDKNQIENLEFLRDLRAVMDPYNAAAVGEVGDDQLGMEILGQYTAGDDLMHMCYAFEFLANDRPSGTDIESVMQRFEKVANHGWACWAFSNHDTPRHASRWDLAPQSLKTMTNLMMCLKGSACIYQGEELGLEQAEVGFEDLQDPYGIEFWPEYKGRDGCRTPMVWDANEENAGFTTGKPWLPISQDHFKNTVDVMEKQQDSLLHHYRAAIKLRNDYSALRKGQCSPVNAKNDIVFFTRSNEVQEIFCAFNLSDSPVELALPSTDMQLLGSNIGAYNGEISDSIQLAPWQTFVALKN